MMKKYGKSLENLSKKRESPSTFKPHVIVANDYEYAFDHTWKNNQWRVLEPLSFDLENADSIKEKAAKWLGRAVALQGATEEFKLYLLLGKPSQERLMQAYTKAENLLNKIPGEREFIREGDEEAFALEVQNEIEHHSGE